MIYCTTNDIVQINLKNIGVNNRQAPNDPHSIHLHGMDVDVANDGVPETSVGAVPSNYGIAPSGIPGAGNVIVYMFHPSGPGTYFYHCHQEASIHVDMGMYGALVVYNPTDPAAATGPGTGNGGVLFGNAYDADVVLMLSDTDIRQHKSEQLGGVPVSFNPVNYTPQYWFINGLSFPNTIHAGFLTGFSWTNWITAHPGYDPLIAYSRTAKPKVLIRMINVGFQTQPMHMHGYHGQLIGSDQRAFPWSSLGYEQKQTVNIGSGETYEWLINLADQQTTSTYNAGTYSKYNPANGSPQLNTSAFPPIPEPATGNPYVGGPVVTGSTLGPAPSQIFVFHNHDDYKATNNGVYPGGMFTIIMPLP
jgi:FtsP/CotA-like multicopper oxidase with cupredoxin domain